MAEVVARETSRREIAFFDATETLAAKFGADAKTYYVPGDMHFNRAGLRSSSMAIEQQLAPFLSLPSRPPLR